MVSILLLMFILLVCHYSYEFGRDPLWWGQDEWKISLTLGSVGNLKTEYLRVKKLQQSPLVKQELPDNSFELKKFGRNTIALSKKHKSLLKKLRELYQTLEQKQESPMTAVTTTEAKTSQFQSLTDWVHHQTNVENSNRHTTDIKTLFNHIHQTKSASTENEAMIDISKDYKYGVSWLIKAMVVWEQSLTDPMVLSRAQINFRQAIHSLETAVRESKNQEINAWLEVAKDYQEDVSERIISHN